MLCIQCWYLQVTETVGVTKEIYTHRNAQLRYTQIVYCTLWEECKQTQCPFRSWKERTKALMWYYSPTKNKLIYKVRTNTYDFWHSGQYGKYNSNIFLFHPLGPLMFCGAPEFLALISSHCSTQIGRISYGDSWSIYFLGVTSRGPLFKPLMVVWTRQGWISNILCISLWKYLFSMLNIKQLVSKYFNIHKGFYC